MQEKKLLIPVKVHAMVLNDACFEGEKTFQRFTNNYSILNEYGTPEPDPWENLSAEFLSPDHVQENRGVYVYWELPKALLHGRQSQKDGSMEYPLIPNRWAVVRCNLKNKEFKSWIVESDFIDENEGSSPYLDDNGNSTYIGRSYALESNWQESSPKCKSFLTALGIGDVAFTSYQPYVKDVLSFHDKLEGYSAANSDEKFSYYVVGWYANSEYDFLSGIQNKDQFDKFLKDNSWDLGDDKGDGFAKSSVFHGIVANVSWKQDGKIPEKDIVYNEPNVKLSVGNTSVGALTAMLDNSGDNNDFDVKLLEAFCFQKLHILDKPNYKTLLDIVEHDQNFAPEYGGIKWEIVNKEVGSEGIKRDEPEFVLSESDKEKESIWLGELNQSQRILDNEKVNLTQMQEELYGLYWKYQNAILIYDDCDKYPVGCSEEKFEMELDINNKNSLAYKVKEKIILVNELVKRVPYGIDAEGFQQAIINYGKKNNILPERVLKPVALSRFWEPTDPVILLAGTGSRDLLDKDILGCRFSDQIMKILSGQDITYDLAQMSDIDFPAFNNLSIVTDLIKEKTIIAKALSSVKDKTSGFKALNGKLPDINFINWKQPWLPLFMQWEIEWYPLDKELLEKEWQFDGYDYVWNGAQNKDDLKPERYLGRVFLTPHYQMYLKNLLKEYLKTNDIEGKFNVEDIDKWDFLSQSLGGLLDSLKGQDIRMHKNPEGDIGNIIMNSAGYRNFPEYKALLPGLAKKVPFSPDPVADFHYLSSGQFCIKRLSVIDRFGQELQVVVDDLDGVPNKRSQVFAPIMEPSVKPTKTVVIQDPQRFIQLPPRVLQQSRLKFEFNDLNKNNPVVCWVVPDYIDNSIAIYNSAGLFLGELVNSVEGSKKKISWLPDYENPNYDLNYVKEKYPKIGIFLENIQGKDASDLDLLFEAIDLAVGNIRYNAVKDDKNPSKFIGNPLALVEANLQFLIKGDHLLKDPSWLYTFEKKEADLFKHKFTVRLGVDSEEDGLVGYFTNNNFSKFSIVNSLKGINDSSYFKYRGTGDVKISFNKSDQQPLSVTMLIDPRASVNAITGILPTKQLFLSDKYIKAAIKNMTYSFKVDSLLTKTVAGSKNKVIVNIPERKDEKWVWLEKESSNIKILEVEHPDLHCFVDDEKTYIKAGYLKLNKKGDKNG